MTWKDRTIIIESVVIVILIAACVGVWRFYYNPRFVYEWKGTTTKTIYVDNFPDDYCRKSPIWIDGKQQGRDFLVTAGDECKHASRLLGVKTDIYHHMPLVAYSPIYSITDKKFHHSVTGMYFYNFGPVALGGGLTAVFDKKQIYDAGPTIGIAAFFR